MSESNSRSETLLRRLEWTVLRRLDGLLQGDYRTLFRGVGLDLADLREYQLHDDVRHIDWNVTARLQVPHVRQFHEDREVTAWFLCDLSPSLDFGSSGVRKRQLSIEFVGVLARLLTRHGNRVGALMYGDSLDTVIPARAGRRQVLRILERMRARPQPLRSAPTDLGAFLASARGILARRAIVFVLSDFISVPAWEAPLGQLARHHEVLAVRLYDPLEREMPDLGMLVFQDAESGEQLQVDTHDAGFRRRFAEQAARREQALVAAFATAGVDALELSTEGDLAEGILRFADLRRAHARLGAGGFAGRRRLPAHLG
jgi:uncharacterized protein (DUF58 family)